MARHLLVTNDYLPKTGGIQVYLHELWRRLEPGRAVVLTASSHDDAAAFDATSEVVIERVASSTLFLPTVAARRAIEEAIRRHQPDLVLFDPAWPLALLGPSLSRPYGVIVHGAEVAIPAKIPLIASSLRFILRRAAVVISAGTYPEAAARFNAAEGLAPVLRVPPGVDVQRFRPLEVEERQRVRDDLGLEDGAFVVASYSRLVPRKGMDTLIAAAAQLRPRYPQLHVVIGGEGRDAQRLRRHARVLKAPVTFLGRVDDEVLPRWLAASDLMVMDCRSRWFGLEQEGFGMVFVEAAACGLAQIAGRSGGSHEAVRDGVTGLVLDRSRSVKDLAAAIEVMINEEYRRQLFGDNARHVATTAFAWDPLARELSEGLAPFDHFEVATTLA